MGAPLKDTDEKSAKYGGLQFASGKMTPLRPTADVAPPDEPTSEANSATREGMSKSVIQNVRAREKNPSTPELPPTSDESTIIRSKSNICNN